MTRRPPELDAIPAPETPRSLRAAGGVLALAAVALVLPSIAALLGAISGKALDFSGRSLDPVERIALVAVPGAVILAFVSARGIWLGRHRAVAAGAVLGGAAAAYLATQVAGGTLVIGDLDGSGLAVNLQAVGGLVAVLVYELLLLRGSRSILPGG